MDYLKLSLVLAPQLLAGCLIYLLLVRKPNVHLIELISVGGVLGIISSTVFDQIFVNLNYLKIGWLIPLVISLFAILLVRSKAKIQLPTIIWRQERTNGLIPVLAIATVALGTEWYWLFPSGVLLVISVLISIVQDSQSAKTKLTSQLTFVSAIIVGFFMVSARPRVWWMLEESDYPFFEALANSLARWGLGDYPFAVGYKTKYHWLSYAWIGLVDRTANGSPFMVLTKVAPVVFVILIVGIAWTIIDQFSLSKYRTFLATLILMTSSTFPIWNGGIRLLALGSPSQFFAFAFSLTTVFLLLKAIRGEIRYGALLIAYVSVATVITKVTHGATIAASFMFFIVGSLRLRLKNVSNLVIIVALAIISMSASFYFFIAIPEASSFLVIQPGDYIWQLQGDLRTVPEILSKTLGLLALIGLSVLPILLISVNLQNNDHRDPDNKLLSYLSSGAFLGGILAAFLLLGAWGENLYFLHAGSFISITLSLAIFTRQKYFIHLKKSRLIGLTVIGLLLAVLSHLIPNVDSGATYAIALRLAKVVVAPWLILVSFCINYVYMIIRKKKSNSTLYQVLVVTISMSLSFTVLNWMITIPDKYDEFSRNGDLYVGSAELKDVSKWIRDNTDKSTIIASNFGWNNINDSEIEFFSMPCDTFRNKSLLDEKCRRTSDALLVAYIERRTWLQSTRQQQNVVNLYSEFTPEMQMRQTVSIKFANEPTTRLLSYLRQGRISWFIVDRTGNNRIDWEPYATKRYENESFFVLELNYSQ